MLFEKKGKEGQFLLARSYTSSERGSKNIPESLDPKGETTSSM